ncbi:MAG: hypothetical protein D8M57_02075 [Candidatus Scalindua sp. AMX11]|nr:MAG: hypothetical protein DWQ00_13435 [Candidatus Scalindua sp.]TDE66523.1 MAG: hypothetical protein D8M57_02075 [Candidatus Scalindua sp. AMX11]GJQ58887.1 MAG: hypothetical protein SCALA701_16880 [Candidatus Scalindua sp.]
MLKCEDRYTDPQHTHMETLINLWIEKGLASKEEMIWWIDKVNKIGINRVTPLGSILCVLILTRYNRHVPYIIFLRSNVR